MLIVAGRELLALRTSPLFWVVAVMASVALGLVFLFQVQAFLQPPPGLAQRIEASGIHWGVTRAVVTPLGSWTAFVLMLAAPILTMRAFPEERRTGTILLVLPSGLPGTLRLAAGKLLAHWAALLALALPAMCEPLLLAGGTRLDWGLYGSVLAGLVLAALLFASVGLACSAAASSAPTAGTVALLLLAGMWVAGAAPETPLAPSPLPGLLEPRLLPWNRQLESFLHGVVDTRALAYFLLGTGAALAVAVERLLAGRHPR